MKRDTWIAIAALLGLVGYWWIRRQQEGSVSPVELGRLSTSTTTQASGAGILAEALRMSVENEDGAIKRLRSDIGAHGLSLTSCSLRGTERWCTLSNGWVLPSWLVVDYFGMKEPGGLS